MARRLLLQFMLFVLLWTNTLLHDIAEQGQTIVAPIIISAHSIACVDAAMTSEDVPADEHCHDAVLGCKFHLTEMLFNNVEPAILLIENLWRHEQTMLIGLLHQRGPPAVAQLIRPKLYLLNRSLLI